MRVTAFKLLAFTSLQVCSCYREMQIHIYNHGIERAFRCSMRPGVALKLGSTKPTHGTKIISADIVIL